MALLLSCGEVKRWVVGGGLVQWRSARLRSIEHSELSVIRVLLCGISPARFALVPPRCGGPRFGRPAKSELYHFDCNPQACNKPVLFGRCRQGTSMLEFSLLAAGANNGDSRSAGWFASNH